MEIFSSQNQIRRIIVKRIITTILTLAVMAALSISPAFAAEKGGCCDGGSCCGQCCKDHQQKA